MFSSKLIKGNFWVAPGCFGPNTWTVGTRRGIGQMA